MPELPEVENARLLLQRALGGRTIVAAEAVDDPIVFKGVTARRLVASVRGRRVVAVRRRGKHLWLELDRRPWPAFHFGMTGAFVMHQGVARPRAWRLELTTDKGARVVFRDPRRFGRIRLQFDPPAEPPISELGFDPLEGLPSARELRAHLERRSSSIKSVLLDQSLFAGVGNWMADEVLYQAGLGPRRPASDLTLPEVRRLRARLHAVTATAVRLHADSDRFPRTWLFHHRWGRRAGATTARAEAIVHETIGGRTTAWVPDRQR